ncbi:MAG TPA: MarR family transcriptional regulator [Chitinophagales bacterium]|nr:MarR family transcriptional regulator [Chitinophagales bacterium]
MITIEQLIKQPKFKCEGNRAVVSILYASGLINSYFESVFKKFDITLQQFNALRILRGQYPKPCTVNLIRDRMLDKMSDASRIVERLRKAGLVERTTSKTDRRAVDVLITQKGLSLLSEIDKMEKELTLPHSKLTEAEAKQLNNLIEKVFDSLLG